MLQEEPLKFDFKHHLLFGLSIPTPHQDNLFLFYSEDVTYSPSRHNKYHCWYRDKERHTQ
jgi:hypothetical protein